MSKPIVLIVDDDEAVRSTLGHVLKDEYEALEARDGRGALEAVKTRHVDMVLLDIMMPGMDGMATLERIKEADSDIGVIMLSARDNAGTAVEALKRGAYDYITKPFDNVDLLSTLRRYGESHNLKAEVEYLKEEIEREFVYGEFVSRSPKMKKIFTLIENVSKTSSTVLITGESGTGKELVARAIHSMGERRERPFVAVNCGAVPSELMESELFGHEKGAFTGAVARKMGKFEYADRGTIFLDEISTLPVHLQTKLLRVLQEKTFERVGSVIPLKVDVMVIAASNIDLAMAVRRGAFREDLYYRLKVVPIELPPLRERKEDVPILIQHFLKQHSRKCNKHIRGMTAEAINALMGYSWPGNIRELENLIERLVVVAREGDLIRFEDLPSNLFTVPDEEAEEPKDFHEAIRAFERRYITGVLNKTGWNRTEAAKTLHMHRNTLLMKMKSLGIRSPYDKKAS